MLLKNQKNTLALWRDQLNTHYGVGNSRVKTINKRFGLHVGLPQAFLRPNQASHLKSSLNKRYPLLDNRLRADLLAGTKFLDELKNNRSFRNRKGYPSRGQRTKTN